MNRIEERKIAFEIIFSFPFNSEKEINCIIDNYCNHEEGMVLTDYINETVLGVWNNIDKIDELIKSKIKKIKFERLDNVCLAILRLAVYEMLFNDEIPVNVAINEAIELIKQYDDSLSAFVHRNLAEIHKTENE